jgi:hypothetical protein
VSGEYAAFLALCAVVMIISIIGIGYAGRD